MPNWIEGTMKIRELKKVLEFEPLDIKTDGSIDRKAVIDFLSGITNLDPKVKGSLVMYIMSLPDMQPERKNGHWLRYGEDGYPNNEDTVFWQCDQCLEQYAGRAKRIPNFCPNCGADMRKENES